MKVTPLDLRQQQFPTVMRGFDRGAVKAFLSDAADDYETALRETERLREEVAKLESALAEHRGQERSLRNALVTAQKVADEITDEAKEEATRLVGEAEQRAELIVRTSQTSLENVQRELEELRATRLEAERTVEALVNSLQTTLDFVKAQGARPREDGAPLSSGPESPLATTASSREPVTTPTSGSREERPSEA
jgi:cell division initiation protein